MTIASVLLSALLGIAMALAITAPALAQVPPSAQEIAQFSALHAAAHRGHVAVIEAAASTKADLNARDSYGRTPLHVAVFAKQREAIKALVKAGANINLLEKDRYDGGKRHQASLEAAGAK